MRSKSLRQSRTHSRQYRTSPKVVAYGVSSRHQRSKVAHAKVAHEKSCCQSRVFLSRSRRNILTAVLDALLWLVGAVFVRLFVNGIMAISSQFWLLGVMVACLPAVTAVWMTHLSPQQGFVLGYRCLIVMTGLLLGGKIGGFS